MVNKYIPEKGDICWASLDPTLGHEQKGRRPVLVVSKSEYNKLSGLAIICPITSVIKMYPYEVRVTNKGVVLADHLRSASWEERNLKFITQIPDEILLDVLNKIKILLDI